MYRRLNDRKKTKYSPFSIFFRLKCQRRCRLQKKTRSKHRRLSGKKLNTYLFRSKCRTGGAVSFYLIIKKGKAFLVKKKIDNQYNQSILRHLELFGIFEMSGTKENLVK